MQNPDTEPIPKETVSQEEVQQQETQQQNNDNKLLSPKASVLIQPRPRAPRARLLYTQYLNVETKGKIINTLLKLKNNGLAEQTVKIVGYYLNHLAVNVDLENPEKVKEFIANKNVNSGFKENPVKAYNYYALVNNIVWEDAVYFYLVLAHEVGRLHGVERRKKMFAASACADSPFSNIIASLTLKSFSNRRTAAL